MNDLTKIRLLSGLVAVLVLLNVAMLGYLWFTPHGSGESRRGPREGRGPAGLVIKELQFDDAQKKQFEVLRNEHHSAMVKLDEKNHGLHARMFGTLSAGGDVSPQVDSLIAEIANIQKEREMITYRHLNMVRRMCKPEQQKIFDDMIKRPQAGRPEGPPPPRD